MYSFTTDVHTLKEGSCQFIFWRQRYLSSLLVTVSCGFLEKSNKNWSTKGNTSINLEYQEIKQCYYCVEVCNWVIILNTNISRQG